MAQNTTPLTPGVVLGYPDVQGKWPSNPEDLAVGDIDTGVLINELSELKLLPGKLKVFEPNPEILQWKAYEKGPPIEEGTYRGTQLALTKIYNLIEQRFSSFMDVANFEPLVPSPLTKDEKLKFFAFTDGSDGYPPHLNLAGNVPAAEKDKSNQRSTLQPSDIFDRMRLLQLTSLLPSVVPCRFIRDLARLTANGWFGPMGRPDAGEKLEDVEDYNRRARRRWLGKDIFNLPNVGDLADWYSDARFAQQQFTGANPTTIERASDRWLQHFITATEAPEDAPVKETITDLSNSCRESLYMQDYSYFREAAGLDPTAVIKCEFDEPGEKGKSRKSYRYGCASVCLFYLNDKGQLYPLAIVLDWRGSAETSVTIYNRELIKRKDLRSGSEKLDQKQKITDEAHDWPWRYAKTCVQCSDWLRHEVTVHLTNTHLIEEAIIVASHRQLDPDHPVMMLLYPHWQKTLALNAAARNTLVPHVIVELIGLPPNEGYAFIRHAYKNFNFKERYVPTDLSLRGFPPEKLDGPKFHNYAYARCIHSMWHKIRAYVKDMLALAYPGTDADQKILNDDCIQHWSNEMQSPKGADLPSFPTIRTFEELVDCVTMCIHIASPQHTAVNYLQNYYQSFVVSKPPCLYAEPPASLQALLGYTEKQLVEALPMNHPREWLLSSHIPYLLSFKPGNKESLIVYAASKFRVYQKKTSEKDQAIAVATGKFYTALADSQEEFKRYGQATDDWETIQYEVLSPEWNAVSILI
ncbi:seed linoleate 13S-lipoxygenase-1 [Aspergillus udagawae]|nr:seed linoleate 13S-lipoxygenase-1 [Aspergillus udagawae]